MTSKARFIPKTYHVNNTLKRIGEQATACKKVFADHTFHKGLYISNILNNSHVMDLQGY